MAKTHVCVEIVHHRKLQPHSHVGFCAEVVHTKVGVQLHVYKETKFELNCSGLSNCTHWHPRHRPKSSKLGTVADYTCTHVVNH